MDKPDSSIGASKSAVRRELSSFLSRPSREMEPVRAVVGSLEEMQWPAAIFGGTLRSLYFSHAYHRVRPRDIDLVLGDVSPRELRNWLAHLAIEVVRETRFGGLQLRLGSWFFDMWPLDKTYLVVADGVQDASFDYLPRTTFLNVEAIAAEAWTTPGRARRVFEHGLFFDGMMRQLVEINRPENPFPELCVVRSMIITKGLGFSLGPKLARYIGDHGSTLTESSITQIQEKHYGSVKWSPAEMISALKLIEIEVSRCPNRSLDLLRSRKQFPGVLSR